MTTELNSLGQTPAAAADFDAMCQDHDEMLRKSFAEDIKIACLKWIGFGADFSMMVEELQAMSNRVGAYQDFLNTGCDTPTS